MNRFSLLVSASLLFSTSLLRCGASPIPREPLPREAGFYRQAMRELVRDASAYARQVDPDFIVVPQNGLGLLTDDGTPGGTPVEEYLRAIDGVGQEELFYGYPRDNQATPAESTATLLGFLRLAREHGKTILVVDYCRSPGAVADSYRRNALEGFLPFAAPRRELDVLPPASHPLPGANDDDVLQLTQARNFLYLIDPGSFSDLGSFVRTLGLTRYDLLIVDAFGEDEQPGQRWLSAAEVDSLQKKAGGGRRLVLAYLSIGEAESYRYYWRREWDRFGDGVPDRNAPRWLERVNPRWRGNYKVRYWEPEWQAILYGGREAYLDGILARGFDGVYLDLIDAFLYFEEQLQTTGD